ncbi:hypothetical protein CEXT_239761 [Caerostris extrusa]|uniref:Uncharacterized protein n=1 Tax=Caerostris extrusa TaxID=172846 RepID=A0AAV4S1Z5_CAEEX|nr:hypothetical protein CEXT_239761 [Caerostris extrusa]
MPKSPLIGNFVFPEELSVALHSFSYAVSSADSFALRGDVTVCVCKCSAVAFMRRAGRKNLCPEMGCLAAVSTAGRALQLPVLAAQDLFSFLGNLAVKALKTTNEN